MIEKYPVYIAPKIEKIGVYAIRCKANNKCYIGSAFNLFFRLTTHSRDLRLRGRLSSVTDKMTEDVEKYGLDNFEFLILQTFENNTIFYEELYNAEKNFVIQYNTIFPNGYNTYYPAPTNASKIHTLIKATTSEERAEKRRQYYRSTEKISIEIPDDMYLKLKIYADSQHKTPNRLIKSYLLGLIGEAPTNTELTPPTE